MSVNDENVWCGGPEPSNVLEGTKSLGELFLKRLKEQGDAIKLIDGITSEEITAKELADRSVHMAKCLIDLGVKPGDKIGICSENRLEFVYVIFGALCVGSTFAPMNTTYGEREIDHALSLSKPKIVFASASTIDKVLEVTKKKEFVEKVVVFGKENWNDEGVIDFSTFYNESKVKSADDFLCMPQDVKENISLILCSSGTTGLPKGVMLTQYNIVIGIHQHYQQTSLLEDELVSHQINMGIIPWFHTFGCFSLIGLMINKATLVFLPKFEEVQFLTCIEVKLFREWSSKWPAELKERLEAKVLEIDPTVGEKLKSEISSTIPNGNGVLEENTELTSPIIQNEGIVA